jgi:putative ABC transport system substrate-binding protein
MTRKTGHVNASLRRRVGADTPCRSMRRALLIALGSALAAPHACFAQQKPAKVARIGFLGSATAASYARQLAGLRLGLRDFGYVEGNNIVIEFRWAEGKYERLAGMAAELVRLKVDVIVTHGTPGTRAAKQATTTIPIVMAVSGDAVATGLIAGVARPGGNITGSTFFNPELAAKRIELLKEALPRLNKMAVLMNPDNPVNTPVLHAMLITARSLKMEVQQFEVRGPHEFDAVFAAMAKSRVDAVVVIDDSMFIANAKGLVELAARKRLPAAGFGEFAEAGGLLGYGVNFPEMFRRAGFFVDRILKGVKPGDIPVERPTKFELIINRNAAKALGITIPNSILVRADRVIE